MEHICRSVYGSYLQTVALVKGQNFELLANSTLNEKFNIQAGVAPGAGVVPELGYLTIGAGGHYYTTGADGIAISEFYQHQSTDAALFKHLPFVLRLTTDDLSESERSKYALRKQIQVDGVNYYAYYAYRLDTSTVKALLEYRTVDGDTTTVSAFIPSVNNLNPTPKVLATSGTNTTTGDFVGASAKLNLSLPESVVTEILNAAKILYKNEAYAVISEIGLVSAVDKVISATSSAGSINFNEIIAAQIYTFFNLKVELTSSRQGWDAALDVGTSEPLFNIS